MCGGSFLFQMCCYTSQYDQTQGSINGDDDDNDSDDDDCSDISDTAHAFTGKRRRHCARSSSRGGRFEQGAAPNTRRTRLQPLKIKRENLLKPLTSKRSKPPNHAPLPQVYKGMYKSRLVAVKMAVFVSIDEQVMPHAMRCNMTREAAAAAAACQRRLSRARAGAAAGGARGQYLRAAEARKHRGVPG